MPLENERKFIIDPASEAKITSLAETISVIRQGYLQSEKDMTARIRRQEVDEEVRHWFTFKRRIGDDVIEIEQRISQRDFDSLSEVAHSWVHKKRVCVVGWEVDYFKANDKTYFCLAEIELPERQLFPDEIPSFVGESLLYAVPLADRRFSSKKLSDPAHAANLLSELKRKAV